MTKLDFTNSKSLEIITTHKKKKKIQMGRTGRNIKFVDKYKRDIVIGDIVQS